MSGLIDILRQELSGNAIGQLSSHIGADPATTQTAVAAALPAMLSGMAQRAQQPDGESAIHEAAQDHAGLLGNFAALLGGPTSGSLTSGALTGGSGILGRVLGDQQTQVQNSVSQTAGLAPDQTHKILMVLAPLALAALAHQRTQGQIPAGALSQLLQGQAAAHQSGIGGMLGQLIAREL